MIKILVGNVYSTLVGLPDNLHDKLDTLLSYPIAGAEYSAAFRKGHWDPKTKTWAYWDGRQKLFKSNRFYTGLLHKVSSFLTLNNAHFEIVQQRSILSFKRPLPLKQPIILRDYQQEVVDAMARTNQAVCKVATGGGKSIIITAVAAAANLKTIIYVISKDLLYQQHSVLSKFIDAPIGIIGDGIVDIQQITVATIWSAAIALGSKYEPYDDEDRASEKGFDSKNKSRVISAIKDAELIFFDEAQFAACSSILAISKSSNNAYFRYGLTATPHREDQKDLEIEGVCGPQIIEITSSQLIRDGWLVKPIIYFVEVPKIELSCSDNYASVYKEAIVENEVRNEKIINITKKLIAADKKVLLLVKQINHGKILFDKLENICRVKFLSGEIDTETRLQVKKDFEEGLLDVIIASTIFDIGLDLPILTGIVLCGSGKSEGRCLQRVGRSLRPYPGKKESIIIDFQDSVKYLNKHSQKRLETYRKESGFEIKFVKDKGNSNDAATQEKKKKPIKLPKLPGGGKVSW